LAKYVSTVLFFFLPLARVMCRLLIHERDEEENMFRSASHTLLALVSAST
jgi:hypothetical protein